MKMAIAGASFHFLLLLLASVFHPAQGQQDNVTATTDTVTEPPPSVNLTNPILQEQVDRFLSIIDERGASVYNDTEYQERFSPSFVELAPLSVLDPIINNLRDQSDTWMVADVLQEQANGAVLLLAPEPTVEPSVVWSISIHPTDGQIIGFLFSDANAAELETTPTSVEEAVAQINDMGHEFNYVVADIAGGEGDKDTNEVCQVIAGQAPDAPAPLGSMFKLWVLAALIDATEDGDDTANNSTIEWDHNVTITEQAKSLSSGIVQLDPVGKQRTVRELAELMIKISDNTATDLLLHLVGRTAVEQAMVETGHHDPSLNMPFLSTKDMFLLKLDGAVGDGRPGPLGEEFIVGTIDERRAIVTDLLNVTLTSRNLDIVKAWAGGPIVVEDIEWFGSPMDLCKVLARLYRNDEARRILALNPGIPDEQGIWSYLGYKGGSEPGVLGLAWYLVPTNVSESHRVVAGTIWNTRSAIDETQVVQLMGYLRDLPLSESSGATSNAIAFIHVLAAAVFLILLLPS